MDLSIPAFDPLPNQYYIRIVSDTWVAVEVLHPVSLRNIKMPDQKTPFTDLIDLTPLPTTALQEPKYEQLYSKFETFNPIQTQLFHTLYHTDSPVFLGAPTGSVCSSWYPLNPLSDSVLVLLLQEWYVCMSNLFSYFYSYLYHAREKLLSLNLRCCE